MTDIKKTIVIGMSGGVDSGVSAYLLKKNGYNVIGVTFKMGASTTENINDARNIAHILDFPFFVIDIKDVFAKNIEKYFVENYLQASTPTPCTFCNAQIKWEYLMQMMSIFSADYVATGHYAKISHNNSRYYFSIPDDIYKDQTFFLWRLSQKQISHTLFPLAGYFKPAIKNLAREIGLNVHQKRESYNICFIPDGNYRAFIETNLKNFNTEGVFLNENGEIVGKHKGVYNYTIGQRVSLPVLGVKYILKMNRNNVIVVGEKERLYKKIILIEDCNCQKYEKFPENTDLFVKVNYKTAFMKCRIKLLPENKAIVNLENTVFAPAIGQSAVIYENSDLVGGGIIFDDQMKVF